MSSERIDDLGRAVVDTETAFSYVANDWRLQEAAVFLMRGAGTVSGIDPDAVDDIVSNRLMPQIERTAHERSVVVLSDGDVDNPLMPDIGRVVGEIRDECEKLDTPHLIRHVAVQTDDWYYPAEQGANLANNSGRPYQTFVIERGKYPGDHTYLTQSPPILANPHTRWYGIGASGIIADEQLTHFVDNVPRGQSVHATLIRAANNAAVSAVLDDKLRAAETNTAREAIEQKITQRELRYGRHWDNEGRPSVDTHAFERNDTEHRVVVIWNNDEANVLDCRLIDLQGPEWQQKFASAPVMAKSQPVRPRIVTGMPETVFVGSGSTQDVARPGDFIFPSANGEEYVVPAANVERLWQSVGDGWYRPVPQPRSVVTVDEDVVFIAPWGEYQAVQKGGAVLQWTHTDESGSTHTEAYGIAAKDMTDLRPIRDL